jgi:hypothetical protein
MAGVADENAMQVAKLSFETWIEPEHTPEAVWVVSVAGFIGCENTTAIAFDATPTPPSLGVVSAT